MSIRLLTLNSWQDEFVDCADPLTEALPGPTQGVGDDSFSANKHTGATVSMTETFQFLQVQSDREQVLDYTINLKHAF